MNNKFSTPENIFKELLCRYPILNECSNAILSAYDLIKKMYEENGTLFVAGNGGSAADSEHIVGELMKSFMAKRTIDTSTQGTLEEMFSDDANNLLMALEGGLPAVSLPSLVALSTAISNDVNGEYIFAQSLYSASKKGDLFLGISTSGNSRNIVNAMMVAKAKGLYTLGLTGKKDCKLDHMCDVVIHVPETETFKIQELHLPVYHALCAMLESHFFGE